MKRALVTGVSGQDGAYLARFLLEQGYDVYGAYRHSASGSMWRLHELGVLEHVKLVTLDLLEFSNIQRVIEKVQPDEVYNLAAQSFVVQSFEQPLFTADVNALGVSRLIEAIRHVCPTARLYQASTSEMFGKVQQTPQTEDTPFYPRSPYGVSKVYGHWAVVNARESWGLHASSGILFNHESPLRSLQFVTRKITSQLAQLARGEPLVLSLGNVEARRDWGFAGDYVDGMWRMVQQPQGGDYVLATGQTHSVRDFVDAAARVLDLPLVWEGEGHTTRALHSDTGLPVVIVSPEYYRPAEVDVLIGDATRAREVLGWTARVGFDALVEQMVRADVDRAQRGRILM